MITIILIATTVLLIGLGVGAAIWFLSRSGQTAKTKEPTEQTPIVKQAATVEQTQTAEALTFHWRYVTLPVAILLLSIALTIYFYRLLPTEVAYHFKFDGSPDKWLSRELTTVLMLAAQFLFVFLAMIVTWGITRLGILSRQTEGTWIKPERILIVMGNMPALPQIIVCFAMLDIFSYNSYQVHIMPLWVFALIVMGLGVIILGIFFITPAIRQAWKTIK